MTNRFSKVNDLYTKNTTVYFEQLHDSVVNGIITKIKELKKIIYLNHQDDFILQENINKYISIIRRMLTTLENYEIYLKNNFQTIIEILTAIGSLDNQTYLVEDYAKPIFEDAKALYERQGNYYVEKISDLLKVYKAEEIVIITRQKSLDYIQIDKNIISVSYYKNPKIRLLDKKVFIFIGSPELFGERFKTVFLAAKYIFIAFDVFNNNLTREKGMNNKKDAIFTVYDNVKIKRGFKGEVVTEVLDQQQKDEKIEAQVLELEQQEDLLKFKSRLVRFANGSWMLVPLMHALNCLELEDRDIHKVQGNKIQIGQFVIFRTQNEQDIIREVADELLEEKAAKYRKNLEIWKKRLRFNVENKGFDRVSDILIKKGIESASVQNIKNWISPYTIEPRCLKELLSILKFNEQQIKQLVREAKSVNNTHRQAGRQIATNLMTEVKESNELIESIQEYGFYKFESKMFKGASFNIEEVRFISEKEYEVPLSQTMILFRKGK